MVPGVPPTVVQGRWRSPGRRRQPVHSHEHQPQGGARNEE